jgi:hypothetical protein
MPNPYNEIEISEDEKASISSDTEVSPTQEAKDSDSTPVESSNQEVTESNEEDVYQMFDEDEGRFIDNDEIIKWRESFNNQSNWQKSNTEKAQNIAKWSKLMDKVSNDEDFRSHMIEYFGEDKNSINSLGLNGIEALEQLEESEAPIQAQNPDKLQSLEQRLDNVELDKRTDVLEVQFNQFVAQNEQLKDEKSQIEFLQFMNDRGLDDFSEAFKFWDYDNAQEQLKHYKELEQNKQRNTGKVIQTKTIGATKEKTPHRIANDYKNVSMDDPEISKYFE